MKKRMKELLAIFLSASMMLSVAPTTAFAGAEDVFSAQAEETTVLSEEPEVELSDENTPEEAEISEPQDETSEETVDIADEETTDEETVDITEETAPEEEEETEDSVFSDGGTEISTQANSEGTPEIVASMVSMIDSRKVFWEQIDSVYITAEISLTYENGETDTVEFKNNNYTDDSQGYLWRAYLKKDGEAYPAGSSLEPGIYETVFTRSYGYESAYTYNLYGNPIVVKSLSEMPEIAFNGTTNVTTEEDISSYYQFTAPEDGFYVFSPMNRYTYAYQKESGSDEVTYFGEGEDFWSRAYDRRGFSLKKGTTYYFALSYKFNLGYDDSGNVISSYSADMTVQKVATVTSLKVDMSKVATSVWERLENLSCDGITYTVTYSDGETFTKTAGADSSGFIDDRYGYEIGPKYKLGDEIFDYGGVDPGTYQVLFYWGGMQIEQVEGAHDIEIKPLSELPKLKVGSINEGFESPEDHRVFYQFTTGKEGRYEIYPVGNQFLVLKDDNGEIREIKSHPDREQTEDGWRNVYSLEENTTYIIETEGGVVKDIDFENEADLMIRRLPEITNIEIIPGNEFFAENWNFTYLQDSKMKITYDEGDPVILNLDEKSTVVKDPYRNKCSYSMKKDDVFYRDDFYKEAGTYQVVANDGYKEFEQDITVQVLPVKELPELKTGKNANTYKPKASKNSWGYYAWYRFTPAKEGWYLIGNKDDFTEIWDEDGSMAGCGTITYPDGTTLYYMEADRTYYVGLAGENGPVTENLTIQRMFSEESTENLEKEIDSILNGSVQDMTETETEEANNLLYEITSRDGKELLREENVSSLISKADALAPKVNKQVAPTQYEVADDLPEEYKNIKVTGANLTALKAARDFAEEGQVFAAKIKIEKSDKTGVFDRQFPWKFTLSIVDVNTNKVVKENIKTETPVQITVALPSGYYAAEGRSTMLSYWEEDASDRDSVQYVYDEQTNSINFMSLTLGSYVLSQCSHPNMGSYWSAVKEATCNTPGEKRGFCYTCSNEVYQEIPATGKHDYSKVLERKDPTCTEAGYEKLECSSCGETTTKVLEPTGGHESDTWVVTKAATALAEGEMAAPCKYCGKILGTKKIPKLKPTMNMSVAANKTITLKVKQSFAVSVSGLAKGDKVASFTSSKKDIATVTAGGKITGKKAGTTVITVKLASGYSASFKVKVQKGNVKTTSITVLNKATGRKMAAKVTLKAKQKITLQTTIAPVTSTEKVTYTSSNKKVATVTAKGVITAKKKGTATVTVKSGSKSYKIKITVK